VADEPPVRIDLPDELIGPRVRLRPYREADAPALWEAIDESRAALDVWMPWASEYRTPADALPSVRYLQARWLLREELTVGIFDRQSGRLLGGSGLARMDWVIRRFEIGYWVRTSAVGQGYATEATQVLTRFAFDQLGARRVEIRMDPRNARSRAVPERLGFTFEGCLRSAFRGVGGQVQDSLVFALLPDEFERVAWRTGA
jgi:RimJ/RimL family protein N-acetyltransferase